MLQKVAHPIASPLSRKAVLVAIVFRVGPLGSGDKTINNIMADARRLHYAMTTPWCGQGLRVLPNALHGKFTGRFRSLKRDFTAIVDAYDPGAGKKRKFQLDMKIFPVPAACDFRSDVLDVDTIEDIRRELVATSENVLRDAVQDAAGRINKQVGHMAKKLATYNGKRNWFADTLVGNVRELAELLPAFNLTNDPALDRLTARIQRELCSEDAETLRYNEAVRVAVQKSADSILKDVESLLG